MSLEVPHIEFPVGQPVKRVGGGYTFPGVVIGYGWKKLDKKMLYMVEATGEGYEGMVHIFRESDLERLPL